MTGRYETERERDRDGEFERRNNESMREKKIWEGKKTSSIDL